MKLTEEQIQSYNENGYLQIEDYLSSQEVQTLYNELPKTIETNSPRVILENDGSIRSIFAPHFINESYKRLSQLDRFVIPAKQLIGSQIYLHQFKINSKKALKGDWWEWHQDFPYWHLDDGIKMPDLTSIMLYLQDTSASNGALMLIPKSHKLGIVKFANKGSELNPKQPQYSDNWNKDYLSSLNSNIKFTIDHSLLKDLAEKNGIVTVSGKKGSVIFFHGNLFHASNINLTPFDRDAVLLTYNSIHNLPSNTKNPRPSFLVGQDYEPIEHLVAEIK
ncbi:ectoine hydroxylase [Pedobacter psychrotolerans]|uniref:Ectoine hydroxylase n=1 Tax=Pedobacter psychrotolerans TaxID=1843235 RepID=A0A4V6NMW9_9SPHI|nr:phytanoyl-CoA dioxygenase family protein [Pedobacter psychrotolerans]TCO17345.1 ectoine hydroxylase [Pedobacter psychrotolerans]GGE71405.1 L-proline 4-hydroxylase [Pedobacter psychrotolerans]